MKTTDKSMDWLIKELDALKTRVFELEAIERAYKQLKRDVGETVPRHSPLMEHLDGAIYVIFDRKCEFINEKFSQLFDVGAEEVCNSAFNPMALVAPESRRLIGEKYKEGIHGEFKSQQYEFTGLTKNGAKIDCETFTLFIPYKWGFALQGIVWDTTMQNQFVDESISNPQYMSHTLRQDSAFYFSKQQNSRREGNRTKFFTISGDRGTTRRRTEDTVSGARPTAF